MFSEVLKIIPNISSSDLTKMERQLGSRFNRIAKKFGSGLTSVLKGGGIAGIALGLIDKLLNPLKETQEAIDRVLKQGDDVVTNAKQFNTTAAKLFKLQQLGKSTGLSPDELTLLLTKFQTAIAEAKQDPNKQTSVRKFVGIADTAEAFFEFIQSLQGLDKNKQVLVQQEVFGEKQIGKMSEFINANFFEQMKATGLDRVNNKKLGGSLENLSTLNDLQDALAAKRETEEVIRRGRILGKGAVFAKDARERLESQREDERMKSVKALSNISEATATIQNVLERGLIKIGELGDKLGGITDGIKKLTHKLSTYKFWGE